MSNQPKGALMDFSDIWQENKRFFVTVGAGLFVFLIGTIVIGSVFGNETKALARQVNSNTRKLKEARYGPSDLSAAQAENEAQRAATKTLAAAVTFEPRPEFTLRPAAGSASNQYFGQVDRVREELARQASRSRLRLPDDLGLEMLKTTRDAVIARHFEALDVIDRVVRFALETSVERIDKIQVRLDPALDSRTGPGTIERTRVTFTLTSTAESVARLIELSQSERYERVLMIESVDVRGARSKGDEVRAEIAFLAVRLNLPEEEDEEI